MLATSQIPSSRRITQAPLNLSQVSERRVTTPTWAQSIWHLILNWATSFSAVFMRLRPKRVYLPLCPNQVLITTTASLDPRSATADLKQALQPMVKALEHQSTFPLLVQPFHDEVPALPAMLRHGLHLILPEPHPADRNQAHIQHPVLGYSSIPCQLGSPPMFLVRGTVLSRAPRLHQSCRFHRFHSTCRHPSSHRHYLTSIPYRIG